MSDTNVCEHRDTPTSFSCRSVHSHARQCEFSASKRQQPAQTEPNKRSCNVRDPSTPRQSAQKTLQSQMRLSAAVPDAPRPPTHFTPRALVPAPMRADSGGLGPASRTKMRSLLETGVEIKHCWRMQNKFQRLKECSLS